MNFKQLEAFYWLSEFQNYRQTAEHLGLTQPAVSARIQSLERDLGKVLIDRETPGFGLTDQGLEVAEFAVDFLNLHEAMMGRLQDRQKRGISIGLGGVAAMTWGALLRERVAETYPEMVFDIHAGSDLQLKRLVQAGTLDMAFTATGEPARDADFGVQYEVGWVARPDLLSAKTMPLSPEALRNMPLVLYPKTSPLFTPVADYVGESHERPAARHYGNSLATICELVRKGFGATALALSVIEDDLASGGLARIGATEPLPTLTLRCTHANRARKKLVVDLLGVARQSAQDWCGAHPDHCSFVTL